MALSPQVISLLGTTIKKNLGPFSDTAAKGLVQIIVEYGPRARGQAEILRAVAKSAPWAIGIVSSAFAFVIAKIGLSENIQIVVDKSNRRLGIQGSALKGITGGVSDPVLPESGKASSTNKQNRKRKPARRRPTKKPAKKVTQARRKPAARKASQKSKPAVE